MNCNKCGAYLDNDMTTCPYCGEKIEEENINHVIINQDTYAVIDNENYAKNKTKAIITILAYFFIFYFVAQLFSSIFISAMVNNLVDKYGIVVTESETILDILQKNYESDYLFLIATSNLITYALLITTIVLLCIKDLIKDFVEFKSELAQNIKKIFIGLGILYLTSIAASIISLLLQQIPIISQANQETSQNQEMIIKLLNSSPYTVIVTIVMTVICAPIVEELIFRKSFFKLFKNKGWLAIIVSGIAFGAIHVIEAILIELTTDAPNISIILYELVGLIGYAGSGIALGYIYKKSNYNITITIGIHLLNNLISVLLINLQ